MRSCTVFKGYMEVTGDHPNSQTVRTVGLRTGMTQTVSDGIAMASRDNGYFLIATGTDGTKNKLPHKDSSGNIKTYYIKFYNSTAPAPGYNPHSTWRTDCMAGGPGDLLGKVSLNRNGEINRLDGAAVTQPVRFDLSSGLNPDTAPAESAVCISDPGAAYGNQAPLTIL